MDVPKERVSVRLAGWLRLIARGRQLIGDRQCGTIPARSYSRAERLSHSARAERSTRRERGVSIRIGEMFDDVRGMSHEVDGERAPAAYFDTAARCGYALVEYADDESAPERLMT